jgi:hypothetical protein
MTWQALAPLFKSLGLPVLAWLLEKLPAVAGEAVKGLPFGGLLSGAVEKAARGILSQAMKALGLDPAEATPEDVRDAIENGDTSEVVSRLKEVEVRAAQTTALVDLFKSDNERDVEIAKVNAETFRASAAADAATNNPWLTAYRPILLFGLTFALLYMVGAVLYAITAGGPILDGIVKAENLFMAMFATIVGVLTGHFVTRSSERKALLAPAVAAPTAAATTVVVPPAAVAKLKTKR